MKTLLIYPPYSKEDVFSYLADSAPVLPPIGLAYLAAYLRKNSFQVNIIDSPAEQLDIEGLIKRIVTEKPQIIGITANSPLYSKVIILGKRIKQVLPHCKIVLGGYHPTFLSAEVLSSDFVDFVVRGEGEETFLEFCRAMETNGDFSDIKGLAFKCQGRLVINEERGFIDDLDKLPFPAYDLLPLKKYYAGNNLGRRNSTISIVASRGCAGNCYFCTSPGFWKNVYRKHSPYYVISLLNYLFENFGIDCFQFRDDTFTWDEDWITELCNLMKKNKYQYRWDCYSRFDTINENLLRLMKEAGCYQVSLGVESANEEILKTVKGFSKSEVYRGMKLLKRHGLKTRLFFMVGPPAPNITDIDNISHFAIELDPDIIIVTASIPYPGSHFYSAMEKSGVEPKFNKEIPKIYEGFCDFDNFNKELIKAKIINIYKNFYLRPRYIIKQALSIKNIHDFFNLLLGGLSIIKTTVRNKFLRFNSTNIDR